MVEHLPIMSKALDLIPIIPPQPMFFYWCLIFHCLEVLPLNHLCVCMVLVMDHLVNKYPVITDLIKINGH